MASTEPSARWKVAAEHRRPTQADGRGSKREAAEELALREPQQRRIRALAGGMRELLHELHRAGVSPDATRDIETRIEELERAVGVQPADRGDVVGAALARLWVLSLELRAKALRGYGKLGPREQAFFDDQSSEFERSVARLRRAVRDRQATRRAAP
jgi:hypothetical protein